MYLIIYVGGFADVFLVKDVNSMQNYALKSVSGPDAASVKLIYKEFALLISFLFFFLSILFFFSFSFAIYHIFFLSINQFLNYLKRN